MTTHPFSCTCGELLASIDLAPPHARALCYCNDCQAFARFLGRADDVLDANGGTEIVALPPRRVRFTKGADRIACVSLSPKGLLRWYASCCRAPIGNTPRDPRVHYVGLIGLGLGGDAASREAAFGPVRTRLNTAAAYGAPRPEEKMALRDTFGIARTILGARVTGAWRDNPFFDPASSAPRVTPRVLTRAEREEFTAPSSRGA